MKDEIREILESVKRHIDYVEATKQCSVRDYEMKVMYDYITNLQEELKEANESITWWSNRFKAVEKYNTKLKQEKDKYYEENLIISQEILNLQDENIKLNIKLEDKAYEQLKVSYKKLQEENEQLRTQMNTCKNVKDKAIDKLYCYGEIFDREILQKFQKEMLGILQGEDK